MCAVSDILDRVWEAVDASVPVVKVGRQDDATVVDKRAIAWSKITASSIVLVREVDAGRRFRLRRIKVMLGNCDDSSCPIIPLQGQVRPGAEAYLLHERQDLFIEDLHDRLAELEQTLRTAPKLLEDVRHLLFLAGVLIDTKRCQGKEQAAALRAFEQAGDPVAAGYQAGEEEILLGAADRGAVATDGDVHTAGAAGRGHRAHPPIPSTVTGQSATVDAPPASPQAATAP